MNSEKRNKNVFLRGFVCIGFIVLLCVIVAFLLKGNTSYTSSESVDVVDRFLYCSSNNPVNPFFNHDGVTASHEIKFVIDEQSNIKNASYTYKGILSSRSLAESVVSSFHFKYDDYMGHTSVYQEDLSPTFTVVDNMVIINLFFSPNNITKETSELLFFDLTGNNIPTMEDLFPIYEKKNFSCSYKD